MAHVNLHTVTVSPKKILAWFKPCWAVKVLLCWCDNAASNMDFWTWQSINSFLICSRSPTPLDRSFSSSDTRVSASKKLGKHVFFFESLVQLFKKEYKWTLITWILCWSEQILWASLIQILMKCQILGSLTGQSGIPIQLLLLVLMHLLLQILIFHLHKRKLLLRVFQIRLGLKTELKTSMKNTQNTRLEEYLARSYSSHLEHAKWSIFN